MASKVIRLQALGGYLKGPLIEVPSQIFTWYTPYQNNEGVRFDVELDTIPQHQQQNARFVSIQRFEVLPNQRVAEIFELEL